MSNKVASFSSKALLTRPGEVIRGLGTLAGRFIRGETVLAEAGVFARATPGAAISILAAEVFFARGLGTVTQRAARAAELGVTRISPKFKVVEELPLGIKVIKEIPRAEGPPFELGLIPRGDGIQRSVLGLAEQARIPLRPTPKLPALKDFQRRIISVAVDRGDSISGSLAQKTLVRGSRTFEDVDIVSRFPKATANAIKKEFGDAVIIKKVEITNSPLGNFNIYRVIDKKTGRQIADIDPIKFAEEGFVRQFPTVRVGDVTFVSPEARLAAKVAQLRRGKVKSGKVAIDIEQLTGGEFTAQ